MLTILRPAGLGFGGKPYRLAKGWELGPDGKLVKVDPDRVSTFVAQVVAPRDIRDLHHLLTTVLEPDWRAIVVNMVPRRHVAQKPLARVAKNFEEPDGGARFMCLDIDGLAMPPGLDLTRDPWAVVAWLAGLLPDDLRGVTFHWHLSGSAGISPGLRIHLWFHLREGRTLKQLKTWAQNAKARTGLPIDASLFNRVQQHYTADPVFFGLPDPLPCRSGLMEGQEDAAFIPMVTAKPVADRSGKDRPQQLRKKRNNAGGKLQDGRNAEGVKIRMKVFRDLRQQYGTVDRDTWVQLSWEEFERTCETGPTAQSSNSYDREAWETLCNDGEYGRLSEKVRPSRDLIPGTAPHWRPSYTPVERVGTELSRIVQDFLLHRRNTVVKITAGSGKTTTTARELAKACSRITLHPGVVHVFTPTLERAAELLKELRSTDPNVRATVIEGRSPENCRRYELVQVAVGAGLNVQKTCCEGTMDDDLPRPWARCPHFDTCRYQVQFHQHYDIYVFAHAQLALPVTRVPWPDTIIIDEDVLPALADKIEVPVVQVLNVPLGREIVAALRLPAGDRRSALREAGITPQALSAVAAALDHEWWDAVAALRNASSADLHSRITAMPRRSPVSRVLKTLAAELEIASRNTILSLTVRYDRDDVEVVACRFRKGDPQRLRKGADGSTEVPILVLDASANRTLLERVIGPVDWHEINVERKARVTQVYDASLSLGTLRGDRADKYFKGINNLLDMLGPKHGEGLAVTNQEFKDRLTLPDGWQVAHFGNLRGANTYKDASCVVVAGRHYPPHSAIEDLATALFGHTSINIDIEAGMVEEDVGYLMRDGSLVGTRCRVWKDPILRALAVMRCEEESIQAVDRARLVHCADAKDVFILCRTPLPIPVDHLVSFETLCSISKLDQAQDEVGPVLPLQAQWLVDEMGHIFGSLSTAKRAVSDFLAEEKGSNAYKGPIKKNEPFSLRYRLADQRGRPSRARVIAGTPIDVVQSELERLHGTAVTLIDPPIEVPSDLGAHIPDIRTRVPDAPEWLVQAPIYFFHGAPA